jgi:hypothetical protein
LQLTAPKAGENVSLLVAVRVRPVLKSELAKGRDVKDILRVIDGRMVLVMDPEDPEDKDYLDQVQNRSKVRACHCKRCSSSGVPSEQEPTPPGHRPDTAVCAP